MWGRMVSGAAVANGCLSRLPVGSQVACGQPAPHCFAVCLAALVLSACSSPVSSPLTEAVACLPPDTQAVAGIYLERIRSQEWFKRLPSAWSLVLDPFRSANLAILAYNGRDILVVASGRFASAPPGAVLLKPELALAGSPAAIRAATRQHATSRTGVPDLVAQAAPVIDRDLWAVVHGSTRLPLPGNGGNLNRLLAFTEYTTASATWDSAIRLEADGHCATPESARQLEERLRALITLAKAAAKAPDLASVLASIELRRDGSLVHLGLRASPQAVQQQLGF
jgi:hypothetical protein